VVVRDLPLADGGYQRVLFYGPATNTRGVIVMFPGGAGDVGIERNGEIRHGDNFVVRTRDLWAKKGYGVLIVDAIDHQSMRGQRSSPEYAGVAHEILAYARSLTNAPVWVMGTSQGSIAAMLAASTARPGEVAGVVLTESVSVLGRSHETVFNAHPEAVRIPALVVANRDDRCWVAPPTYAGAIAKAMSHSSADVLMEEGGKTDSTDACSSQTPHGYWGIDARVVDDIGRWMAAVDAGRHSEAG
jgi:alpha-beta hydrolase superfamily lysophospholipase